MTKYKYDIYYEKIKELHKSGVSAKQIVEEIGDERLTVDKVYKIMYRLGITQSNSKKQKKTEEIDMKAMELISQGVSHREVAKILDIDQQTMTLRLKKKYNIEVLPDGKKKVDSSFFENIDTEEKAYWLGFMYADGYVSKKNSVELCLKDKDHIEKFKMSLKSEHLVSKKNIRLNDKIFDAYRISMKDTKLANDLNKQGCFNNKSFVVEFPSSDQVPKELYRPFIRGFFDGDGDISKTGNKNGYKRIGFTCANKEFLESISSIIFNELGFTPKLHATRNIFALRIESVVKAYKFLEYIYKDANFYLDRKYKMYKNFILPSYIKPTKDIR